MVAAIVFKKGRRAMEVFVFMSLVLVLAKQTKEMWLFGFDIESPISCGVLFDDSSSNLFSGIHVDRCINFIKSLLGIQHIQFSLGNAQIIWPIKKVLSQHTGLNFIPRPSDWLV